MVVTGRFSDPDPGLPIRSLDSYGDYTNRHVVSWLDSLTATGKHPPVFLYIQYMEPHSPYAPPEAAFQRVLEGRKKPDLAEVNLFAFVGDDAPIEERVLRDLRDVYDAEVLSLDMQLRRLFAAWGRAVCSRTRSWSSPPTMARSSQSMG